MPYAFDVCTNSLGPLRQPVFSCKTCHPSPTTPPAFSEVVSTGAAAICYSCSISCHGDHELVEIFNKRDIACDCGTERMPEGSKCELRKIGGEVARVGNRFCHNYWGKFCACDLDYDPEKEKGTMYQCILGDACGEDWFHDTCIVGEERAENGNQKGNGEGEGEEGGEVEDRPKGFPAEEDFEYFICWECVSKNPWLGRYAGTPGFLAPVYKNDASPKIERASQDADNTTPKAAPSDAKKRKAEENGDSEREGAKRAKTPDAVAALGSNGDVKNPVEEEGPKTCHYEDLPHPPSTTTPFSMFLTSEFRSHLCRCAKCFPRLAAHDILLEEEETYEPPLDEDGDNHSTHSAGSLFDLGERALGSVSRVKAIEGIMAYNNLKEGLKGLFKQFADKREPVSAEAVKNYFAELRGEAPSSSGAGQTGGGGGGATGDTGDSRREQSGELSLAVELPSVTN